MTIRIFRGTLIDPVSPEELTAVPGTYIIVEDGFIKEVSAALPEAYEGLPVGDHGEDLILPAFSDLHIHASQYAQRGIGMDKLLFDWLNDYTFPQESHYESTDYARAMYARCIRDLLRHGTMHAAFFTTIHYDACDLFYRMLMKAGMHAYVSKINMDRNSPDFYVEDTEKSLKETDRFISEHISLSDRVKPILIPRFAPTCSKELLQGLGRLVKKYDLGLHTHLVESKAEAAWAKELFPEYVSDGRIYEALGLLDGKGPKIFAHVIYPTSVEERILKEYHAVSVHCPISTANITAGIMPFKEMSAKGLDIALGTDIGGGHFPGVYRVVSEAIVSSKLREHYLEDDSRIGLPQAFYAATVTGGSVFDRVGRLAPGYRFNALVVENKQDEGITIPPLEVLERFCYAGDDRDIRKRYLEGQEIDPEQVYRDLVL